MRGWAAGRSGTLVIEFNTTVDWRPDCWARVPVDLVGLAAAEFGSVLGYPVGGDDSFRSREHRKRSGRQASRGIPRVEAKCRAVPVQDRATYRWTGFVSK